ncbi:hypothetical protein [Burkholderia territorii]|uniref:hypothetical protein n=1 Tax=Burkholderia territorii TaxID=1503055 RepID=UPI000B2AA0D8|nr:hypothetical protein [Burkholderia territorii]
MLDWLGRMVGRGFNEKDDVSKVSVSKGGEVKEIKTLVIGSLRHDHVKSVQWADVDTVNILDFDIVLIYLPSLSGNAAGAIGSQALFQLQGIFAQFLKSNGDLYVLGAPPRSNDNFAHWLWCPIPLISSYQKGDTVSICDDKFKGLLSRLKSWDCLYQLHPHHPAQVLSNVLSGGMAKIEFEFKPYAVNRAGGILAGRFTYYTRMRDDQRHKWPGAVTVLPHFPNDEPHSIVAAALTDILGKPQSEGVPEWLSSISMSCVVPIDATVASLRHEIAELEEQVKNQLAEKERLERFKRLLYVSSFELEDLVAECLSILGAAIKPARYSQEEFVMEWGGSVFLAECKGVSKSISLAHLRQVQDYVLKYEEDEGAAGKGILFGNAWREMPPDERNTRDRPIFPGNVVERAQQFGVALVSSVDFFYAFSRFLDGAVPAEAVLAAITGANGIADLSNLQGR